VTLPDFAAFYTYCTGLNSPGSLPVGVNTYCPAGSEALTCLQSSLKLADSVNMTSNPTRQRSTRRVLTITALILLIGRQSWAATSDREQLLGEALVGSIAKQEIIWLDAGNEQFMTLYRPDTSGSPRGGAIILPPLNAHPDWPGVIHQLRKTLPEFGWSTLSVQLPLLNADTATISEYGQTLPEIGKRIEAAIRFFNSKGIANIALIGKGMGATAGAGYLADDSGSQIQALVGISLRGYAEASDSWLYSPNSLRKLSLPILDIYGSRDYQDVTNSVTARARSAKQASLATANSARLSAFQHSATAESAQTRRAGYIAYRQIRLAGADSHYSGSEDYLVKRVVGWLKQHAGGITMSWRQGAPL